MEQGAFDMPAFKAARLLKYSGNVVSFHYDPMRDIVVVEYLDGTVHEIPYSVLCEDKNKKLHDHIMQQITNAHKLPCHVLAPSTRPNLDTTKYQYPPSPPSHDEPWIREFLYPPAETPKPEPVPKTATRAAPRVKRLIKI